MTGHQENPGTGYTLQGEVTEILDIETVVRALGVKNVRVINPMILAQSKEAIEWALGLDEPSVIITRWPCVLKRLSASDKAEFGDYKGLCAVDAAKCIGCRMCLKTGCPALQFSKETKKVLIDKNQCIGCTTCLQTCPAKAITRVGE